jgi:type IV pilus assembly protein PilA
MIVVVIIGLLAAMAIPAFQKVRATSQDKAVINNLRQFASAAQQYMLETGATTVSYDAIVGDGLWINTIESVGDEDYTELSVDTDTTEITIESPSGNTVGYTF